MVVTKSPFKHVLLTASPGWGHLRPLLSIASKIVHERADIIITFTMTGDFEHKLRVEIDRYFKDDEETLKHNIRSEIRKVSGRVVPVLAWNTTALNSSLHFFGPESFGGLGNVSMKAEILAKETGRPVDDIIRELFNPEAGEVIELPGMPPMYDYEFNPHHENSIETVGTTESYNRFFEESDGIIALGNAAFDPEACAAYRRWFAPRPAYIIGPLLPEEPSIDDRLSESQKELTASSNGVEIKLFLDTVWETYRDRSLLYAR
ncbi:hypothetical protein Clacol_001036 [Clathrus columnatus]|uniref:Uncharacterized protein n=1 Tax=Clathrus columnatus TaxID=1419009 RepID=A0AAV4ZYB9_9AGAM|nr:hypothetical protein Clacol_001036 [Clathrus columnatus]